MTYDALLALRGWGAAEFATVRPEFLQAARFAVFAERVAPILSDHREAQATPIPKGGDAMLIKAKLAAEKQIPIIRDLLGLTDGD